jgi:Pyridoxamine 5'-phosphate oxidase
VRLSSILVGMGRIYNGIDARLAEWLTSQPVFFVATAPLAGDGHINCSPKGNRGEFAVLGEHRVGYVDQTGSGAETIAHVNENGRIVVMFCAFAGPPRIVRLHGRGRAVLLDDAEFPALATGFAADVTTGVRAIVVVDVTRVADSCGYGVPVMEFDNHRSKMEEWADRKGADGIRAYWVEKNTESIDGLAGVPPPR